MNRRRIKRICAVPGCGKVLSRTNASGVCMAHNHKAGFCGCPKCRGIAGAARKPYQARPGVRTALVPTTGNAANHADSHIRISLPLEPWLGGKA